MRACRLPVCVPVCVPVCIPVQGLSEVEAAGRLFCFIRDLALNTMREEVAELLQVSQEHSQLASFRAHHHTPGPCNATSRTYPAWSYSIPSAYHPQAESDTSATASGAACACACMCV